MDSTRVAVAPMLVSRRLFAVLVLLALLVASAGVARSNVVTAEPAPLKAVIIAGPMHGMTDQILADSETLAQLAEWYGMDVRRVFHPHATWANVMANVEGANLVVYMGHGYGWPSPYPPFREQYQDGIGLNPVDDGARSDVKYYGARWIRENWHLAPNAIVFLNHLCYAAGNGESGMAIPSYDLARQRVDNFASGFLAAGARAVLAYSWQNFKRAINQLFTTDMTIEEIFKTVGARPRATYGWIGANARRFDSVRTPGAVNLLDPDPVDGFLRAVSGELSLTAGQWRGVEPGTWTAPGVQVTPPTPTGLSATTYNNRWVRLSWQPVNVNYFGGATYVVFRNGSKLGSAGGTTLYDNQPVTTGSYNYQVRAVDPAGATSPLSGPITVQVVENAGRTLPNATPNPTATPSPTTAGAPTPSSTPTRAPSATPTRTPSPTPTRTPSPSPTRAPTPTPTRAPTATPTRTPSPTPAPVATLPPATGDPLPATNLRAVAQSGLVVTLSWNASPSAANRAVKYRIFRDGYLRARSETLTFVDALWMPGRYRYEVQTIDALGRVSQNSTPVWIHALTDGTPANVTDVTAPTMPTNLAAQSLGNLRIRVTWRASTDSGPSAVGYLVLRGRTAVARVSEPVYVDRPPSVGTYSYRIVAFDGYGNFTPSDRVYGQAAP